ncbi:MAG: PAS domain S-box protein, partial [Acidobacteriota bacterium]|nr:PAS domain S-box protein [Acidobacteriota bacterium]
DYLEMPQGLSELPVKVARLAERHRVERHYRDLVEKSLDIIYTSDIEGRITSINEAGTRFFGRPAEELIGLPLHESVCSKSGSAIDVTSGQEPDGRLSLIYRVKDVDGELRYFEAMNMVLRDSNGQRVGVRGVMRNITERKRADDFLRESEERMRAQYQGFPVPTYSWRYVDDDFEMIDFNDAAGNLTYGRAADLIGRKASDVFRDRSDILTDFHQCCKEKRIIKRETLYRMKSTDEDKNLSITYVYVPPNIVMAHLEDITARKKVEESEARMNDLIRKAAFEWRTTFDEIRFPLLVVDLSGCVKRLNRAAQQFSGESYNELIGRPVEDLGPGQPWHKAAELVSLLNTAPAGIRSVFNSV